MIGLLPIILFLIETTPVFCDCQPPDIPYGGFYVPTQSKYLPGDRVFYNCTKGFTRIGRESMFCRDTGKWSGSIPFCDAPSKVKNPRATSDPGNGIFNVIDGKINTCYRSKSATDQSLQVFIEEPNAINAIRLFLMKGNIKLQISTAHRGLLKPCAYFDRDLEENEWVQLECYDNRKSIDSLRISDVSSSANVIGICEIEVYTENDVWCKTPPQTFIPNGYLEVSRDKATLRCADGYKEGEYIRLVCDKNYTWSIPNLQCNEILCDSYVGNGSNTGTEWRLEGNAKRPIVGTHKKLHCSLPEYSIIGAPVRVTCQNNGSWSFTNATCTRKENDKKTLKIIGIAVGSVVVFLIFFCMGLTLCCIHKQKGKQVVVVYTSGDASTLKAVTDAEAEYSSVYYEAAPPLLPRTLSPRDLSEGYAKPVDALTPIPAKRRPSDIAFGTLKSSALYGT